MVEKICRVALSKTHPLINKKCSPLTPFTLELSFEIDISLFTVTAEMKINKSFLIFIST